MDIENLESTLMKLSVIEQYHKKHYLDNHPIVKKVAQPLSNEQRVLALNFAENARSAQHLEHHAFLGTGNFEKSFSHVPFSDTFFTINQDTQPRAADAFISQSADIAAVRIHRYFDLTEIFESINIYFVFSGIFNTVIADEPFSLKKGSVLILPPYIMQLLFIENDDDLVLALMIRNSSFAYNFHNILESSNSCAEFFNNVLYCKNNNVPFAIFNSDFDKELKNIVLKIMAVQYDCAELQNLIIRNLTESFLLRLFSQYKNCMTVYTSNSKTTELVHNIIGYINENYSTTTLDSVAKQFSYSATHISRILYQKLGKKYSEVLTGIRLNKAQEFLINTDLSVENICNRLGYNDSRQLRFLFRKAYGISPSEFRKQHSQM